MAPHMETCKSIIRVALSTGGRPKSKFNYRSVSSTIRPRIGVWWWDSSGCLCWESYMASSHRHREAAEALSRALQVNPDLATHPEPDRQSLAEKPDLAEKACRMALHHNLLLP
jgi:hypothetical protein